MMKSLEEVIKRALETKKLNNFSFVTVWKTGQLYGFNFERKYIGYSTRDYGVKRTVIGVY